MAPAEKWDGCTDCRRLLAVLSGQVSNRKLRLLAVAWCHRLAPLLADARSRKAVEVGERFAVGAAPGGRDGSGAAAAGTAPELAAAAGTSPLRGGARCPAIPPGGTG